MRGRPTFETTTGSAALARAVLMTVSSGGRRADTVLLRPWLRYLGGALALGAVCAVTASFLHLDDAGQLFADTGAAVVTLAVVVGLDDRPAGPAGPAGRIVPGTVGHTSVADASLSPTTGPVATRR